MKLIIKGHPVVLKNNKEIAFNRKTGARFIKSSKRVDAYKPFALLQLKEQFHHSPITIPISAQMIFYGVWKSGAGNIPDMSNLYQMPEDLLEEAGIILNDNLIEHHDGSRRIRLCDDCHERPKFKAGPKKGQFKEDCGHVKKCPFERVEIVLRKYHRASDTHYPINPIGSLGNTIKGV